MEKRASRLRKGQASPERTCHISNIPISLSILPPATVVKGSNGKRTGKIKVLMYTSKESHPYPYNQGQSLKSKQIWPPPSKCKKNALNLLTPFCLCCYEPSLIEALRGRKSMSIMPDDCLPPEHLPLLLRSQRTHKRKNPAVTAFSVL